MRTLETVRAGVSWLPGYDLVEGIVLDTLFGPEDTFEYVSTTTPAGPPPPPHSPG